MRKNFCGRCDELCEGRHTPKDCILALKKRRDGLLEATSRILLWEETYHQRLHRQQFEIWEIETPLPKHSKSCQCCFCELRRASDQ